MLKRIAHAFAAALMALGFAGAFGGSAEASLLGQRVTCHQFGNGSTIGGTPCSEASAVVGPRTEFFQTVFFGFTVDVGENSITIAGLNTKSFGGVAFFLSLGNLIWSDAPAATLVGVANFSASGVGGLEQSDLTILPNGLILDYNGTQWSSESLISFDLVTTHSGRPGPLTSRLAALPEPASLALFGLGLAGLGFAGLGPVARRKGYAA